MGTKEIIQESINSRLVSSPTKIEGGTIQDLVGSISYELANIIDTKIDIILENAFVKTADEEHLILKGEELGLYKKEGKKAKVIATISDCEADFLIQKYIKAKTSDNIVFQVFEEASTDANGSAQVLMECVESGTVGNINSGELKFFVENYVGLENAKIVNKSDAYDGFEEEDIEAYRNRILDYLKDDSMNSNISDYINWAKSVVGVKSVVVKDATVAGNGCVRVYISSLSNKEVSEELICAVKEKIEKEQIINAKTTVLPLENFAVNIQAKIKVKEGIVIDDIKNNFVVLLEKYLNEKRNVISYFYILNLLFEVSGITDVIEYTINENKTSLEIDELFVPVVGEVNFIIEE